MPVILARMVEGKVGACFRVGRVLTGCLMKGASNTGQRQVARYGLAACGDRDNMVDVERCGLSFLGQLTIFTATAGS